LHRSPPVGEDEVRTSGWGACECGCGWFCCARGPAAAGDWLGPGLSVGVGHRKQPIARATVDDQPIFRAAARDVIDATAGFEAVGEAASGEDALRVVDELGPQLVLLDVRMRV
jgi:Response regulator receiver domain